MRFDTLIALLLTLSIWACEQDSDAPDDAGVVDAGLMVDTWLPDITFPDAELDPCVPRELGQTPAIGLLGVGDEPLAAEYDDGYVNWFPERTSGRAGMPLGWTYTPRNDPPRPIRPDDYED